MKELLICISLSLIVFNYGFGQDATESVRKVKAKIEQVRDYQASGTMKTNVPFLKVPPANVTVYFKSPGRLKIRNDKGISLVPKGAVSMSLNKLMANKDYTAIASGSDNINGVPVKIIKLLPLDENADVVLSTLYIDESRSLIMKARTTTRENGTYELEMDYGKFANYALPDKAIFTFNTKEYKLPKGVTFDYDDGSKKAKDNDPVKSTRGRLEITYNDYRINKGIDDAIFK